MNETEFLNGINDIDPKLLEDEPEKKRGMSRRPLRWAAVAAVLLLALGGTTVFALTNGITLGRFNRSDGESGFTVEAGLPRVKWSSFKGDIRDAGGVIAEQYVTFTPAPDYSSTLVLPGVYGRSFDNDLDGAMDYLGLKALKKPTFPYGDYTCSVISEGDAEGRVHRVTIRLEHVNGYEISAQESITVLTDASPEDKFETGGVWTQEFPRNAEFLTYATPGGNECRIVLMEPQFDTKYMGIGGYVVRGCGFYELHLGGVPVDEQDRAIEMIHAWADALD